MNHQLGRVRGSSQTLISRHENMRGPFLTFHPAACFAVYCLLPFEIKQLDLGVGKLLLQAIDPFLSHGGARDDKVLE